MSSLAAACSFPVDEFEAPPLRSAEHGAAGQEVLADAASPDGDSMAAADTRVETSAADTRAPDDKKGKSKEDR